MNKTLAAAAIGVLFVTPALAQTSKSRTAPQTMGAAPSSGMPADEFVKKAAIGDMFEIQSSQLALNKSPDADTKPFAAKMAKEHQMTSAQLKQLVEGGKVNAQIPTALDSEHQQKLDSLRALNGREFDVAYDKMQLEAHQQAVSLFDSYAKNGDNPQLKQWAQKTLPHLKEHLSMAQKLK
jgi:putative membrane protein